MIETKTYLGDSVYAEYDGFGIVLITENGMGPSNTIYMEPKTLYALDMFVKQLQGQYSEGNKNESGDNGTGIGTNG